MQKSLRESMARLDHSLSELFAMREVLEVPAARWAAQRQDRDGLAAVQAAFAELDEALREKPRNYERLQDLDAAFHLRIVQAAGNRLLEQSQGVLNELLLTGLQTTLAIEGRAESSRDEHLKILTALLEGDAAGSGPSRPGARQERPAGCQSPDRRGECPVRRRQADHASPDLGPAATG